MNKILPLILFLITNCVFSITNTAPTNKKNKDSLINSHQKASHNQEAEIITSNSFINALEKKFPKQSNSSTYKSISPEFSWDYIQKTFIPDSLTTNQKSTATESFNKIDNENLWVDQFANEDIVSLPIGVKYNLGNVEYAIGIVKAEFHADYTILTAFARVTIQQSDKDGNPMKLFFGADDVKLSHQGGIIDDAKLVLLGDVPIPFNGGNWLIQLHGGLDYRSGITNALSYVTIDCSGIKNLALNGTVEFSRNMLIPIEQDGKVHEEKTIIQNNYPNRVRGAFNIIADNWSDILVEISLQPFVRANKRNGKDYKGNMEFYINLILVIYETLLIFNFLVFTTKMVY